MSKQITLTIDGLDVSAIYSHTETHWKGKINIYNIKIGDKIEFRFLDNYNFKKYREDLITSGILSYVVDSYFRTYQNELRNMLWSYLKKEWVESVKVFLVLNKAI